MDFPPFHREGFVHVREEDQDLVDRFNDAFDLPVRENARHYLAALTHRSYANEQNLDYDNERLEFLGDAVLETVVSEHLFRRFPEAPEGRLSKIKSASVNTEALKRIASRLGLEEYVRLSKGEARSSRGRAKVVADGLEALMGAIYLSAGARKAREFILPHLRREIDRYLEEGSRNYKGMLLEVVQEVGLPHPEYVLEDVKGPQHDPVHVVSVRIDGELYGRGRGDTKKEAEQAASEQALERLDRDEGIEVDSS